MVEIPEAYIIFFLGVIFVPLFVFLVKMIIEAGKNATRLDLYDAHIEDTKKLPTTIELIKQRLEDLENDVKELFRRVGYRRNDYFDHDQSHSKRQ